MVKTVPNTKKELEMQAPEVLSRFRNEVDAFLRDLLKPYQLPFYDMIRYHLGWIDQNGKALERSSGKAIRPTLCLMACEATDAGFEVALPAAAAVELVHNFSLVHDDVQDDDRMRRHQPTVWSIWGKPQAINVGTSLRVLANTALRKLEEPACPLYIQLAVQDLIDRRSLQLIEGQYLDIDFESRNEVSEYDYLGMVHGKTGALIACALESGSLIGGRDRELSERFGVVGWTIGKAFQIKDDILGCWGSDEVSGKPVAGDIRKKKKSYPITLALEKSMDRQELLSIYKKEKLTQEDVDSVLSILDREGTKNHCERKVHDLTDQASAELAQIHLRPERRRDFEELFDFLLDRTF